MSDKNTLSKYKTLDYYGRLSVNFRYHNRCEALRGQILSCKSSFSLLTYTLLAMRFFTVTSYGAISCRVDVLCIITNVTSGPLKAFLERIGAHVPSDVKISNDFAVTGIDHTTVS